MHALIKNAYVTEDAWDLIHVQGGPAELLLFEHATTVRGTVQNSGRAYAVVAWYDLAVSERMVRLLEKLAVPFAVF